MKQQINLYQPQARKAQALLSAHRVSLLLVVVTVTLAASYAVRYVQLRQLETRVQALETQRLAAAKQVEDYTHRYPPKQKSARLETRLKAREHALQKRQRVVDMLESGAVGNTQGFSAQLTALARQMVEGAWLTGFTLANGGRAVTLSGSTVRPALVPAYIRNLTLENIFKGLSFERLELDRPQQDPHRVDFRLSSPGAIEETDTGGRTNG